MKSIIVFFIAIFLAFSIPEHSFCQSKSVHVKSYTKKNGTKVKAHNRSPKGSGKRSFIYPIKSDNQALLTDRKSIGLIG